MVALRKMWDSDRAGDIPLDASMVAGYVDGVHPWTSRDWLRFHPATVRVRIARSWMTSAAHVLDSENGLATVDQTVRWVARQQEAGRVPGVYCNLDRWPALVNSLTLARVAQPWFWVAHWGIRVPTSLPPGMRGLQYASPDTSGGHFDLSMMAAYLPGVDPRPAPVVVTGGKSVELTNKVRDRVALDGTSSVEECLSTVLHGIEGEREAGALYVLLSDIYAEVKGIRADVDALKAAAAEPKP